MSKEDASKDSVCILGEDNILQWKTLVENALQAAGTERTIGPGWVPFRATMPMPEMAADGLIPTSGRDVEDARPTVQARADFNVLDRAYKAEQERAAKDSKDEGISMGIIRKNLTTSTKTATMSITTSALLFAALVNEYTAKLEKIRRDIEAEMGSFKMGEAGEMRARYTIKNETITHYKERFSALDDKCTAAGIALVNTVPLKITKILDGLSVSHMSLATILTLRVYAGPAALNDMWKDLANGAHPIEKYWDPNTTNQSDKPKPKALAARGGGSGGFKRGGGRGGRGGNHRGRGRGAGSGGGPIRDKTNARANHADACKTCGFPHSGSCIQCFKCKGYGHRKAQCPNKGSEDYNGDNSDATASGPITYQALVQQVQELQTQINTNKNSHPSGAASGLFGRTDSPTRR